MPTTEVRIAGAASYLLPPCIPSVSAASTAAPRISLLRYILVLVITRREYSSIRVFFINLAESLVRTVTTNFARR